MGTRCGVVGLESRALGERRSLCPARTVRERPFMESLPGFDAPYGGLKVLMFPASCAATQFTWISGRRWLSRAGRIGPHERCLDLHRWRQHDNDRLKTMPSWREDSRSITARGVERTLWLRRECSGSRNCPAPVAGDAADRDGARSLRRLPPLCRAESVRLLRRDRLAPRRPHVRI